MHRIARAAALIATLAAMPLTAADAQSTAPRAFSAADKDISWGPYPAVPAKGCQMAVRSAC